MQNQDLCRHQRQCGQDPSVDGVDRDAGAEVPAVEIDVFLVVIDAGGAVAAATILLSRSVGVVGRSFLSPAGSRRRARRCATTGNHVVGGSWTADNRLREVTLI